MATEEEQQHLADAIKRLPMRLRRPFVMAHMQGKSRYAIAHELHISERQVEKRLTKALDACYRDMERKPGERHAPLLLQWLATPFVIVLVLLVHGVYIVVVRTCGLLGLRPPRPWIR